ncbi:NADPH-dependent FMN reductase [Tistrella mobilis]|uniref:NADPH-dependent FMN reductase n=1 Tax=Tistrella mobilis TaxID=171437 RepID=UPI0035581954
MIAGSLRRPSHTHGLCRGIADRLQAAGLAPVVFDMRDTPLPMADPAWHHQPADHPDPQVKQLVAAADAAAAIVLASPIYHNGPSGVLKNALDLMAIPQFAYKPVGLVSHGGARTTQAVEQMRIWTRGLLGHAIATQVCSDGRDFTPAADGGDPVPGADHLVQRMDRFVRELVVMAQVMQVARRALI